MPWVRVLGPTRRGHGRTHDRFSFKVYRARTWSGRRAAARSQFDTDRDFPTLTESPVGTSSSSSSSNDDDYRSSRRARSGETRRRLGFRHGQMRIGASREFMVTSATMTPCYYCQPCSLLLSVPCTTVPASDTVGPPHAPPQFEISPSWTSRSYRTPVRRTPSDSARPSFARLMKFLLLQTSLVLPQYIHLCRTVRRI